MNSSKFENHVTPLPSHAAGWLLIAALAFSALLSPDSARALQEDEPMPEGTWGGYAGPQINAQKVLYETMLKVASNIKHY